MSELRIFICADASPKIGTGHIMRELALAQAANVSGIPVHITGRAGVEWVRERLKNEDVSFSELDGLVPETENPENLLTQLSTSNKGDWIVLDGYHFGLACQQAVRAAGYKLLVIDDYAHLPEYSCDILLNQNIGAKEFVYKGYIGQQLLGPNYALLRPEFFTARKKAEDRQFPKKARNILLTLGGGDFSEHLARIAPNFAFPELEDCNLRVIAGAVPPERIHTLLWNCRAKLEILNHVNDMPALLLDTDLCVTAGGSTCWELCCLGVPFLTVEVAENQRYITYFLQKIGIAPDYIFETFAALMLNRAVRQKQASAGLALVDGLGAGRVINAMTG